MPPGPTAEVRLAAASRVLTCGVLVAVAVTVNASAVHGRQNLADSHLFGYYGWCVSQGARPYLDVWDNKPPGIWWVNAAAVVISITDVPAVMRSPRSPFADWLDRNYENHGEFDGMYILTRRPAVRPGSDRPPDE